MPDLLISDFIDLQNIGQDMFLSWDDQSNGPQDQIVWTSTCKCKGVFWDPSAVVLLTFDLQQCVALQWVRDPAQRSASLGRLLLRSRSLR